MVATVRRHASSGVPPRMVECGPRQPGLLAPLPRTARPDFPAAPLSIGGGRICLPLLCPPTGRNREVGVAAPPARVRRLPARAARPRGVGCRVRSSVHVPGPAAAGARAATSPAPAWTTGPGSGREPGAAPHRDARPRHRSGAAPSKAARAHRGATWSRPSEVGRTPRAASARPARVGRPWRPGPRRTARHERAAISCRLGEPGLSRSSRRVNQRRGGRALHSLRTCRCRSSAAAFLSTRQRPLNPASSVERLTKGAVSRLICSTTARCDAGVFGRVPSDAAAEMRVSVAGVVFPPLPGSRPDRSDQLAGQVPLVLLVPFPVDRGGSLRPGIVASGTGLGACRA